MVGTNNRISCFLKGLAFTNSWYNLNRNVFYTGSNNFNYISQSPNMYARSSSSSFMRTSTRTFAAAAAAASSSSSNLQVGIVGLPNVGKSTLFNALTGGATAQAENYPFCTIDPNTGLVQVPDERLNILAEINKSVKILPTNLEFVDIAGLIKGASQGEGLGNKFLANIRETDAITQVVRCFDNDDIIHVHSDVDPVRDIEIINIELALSDMAQIEKRLEKIDKDKRKQDIEKEKSALLKLQEGLNDGKMARHISLDDEEKLAIKNMGLLTLKSVMYAANVDEMELKEGNDYTKAMSDYISEIDPQSKMILVSAQVEAELALMSVEDRQDFLSELGTDENNTGLRALVRSAYDLLGLQSYFTSGPTETRAWTIKKGSTAPQAAGLIHTDFEKGFIRAETIAYKDMIEHGSEKACKDMGMMRSEGKDYIVEEGDIILFRFNV